MLNILTGRLECTLYKDQEVLAKQVQSSLPSDPKKAAFFILGCALGGAVFGYTTATVVELIGRAAKRGPSSLNSFATTSLSRVRANARRRLATLLYSCQGFLLLMK